MPTPKTAKATKTAKAVAAPVAAEPKAKAELTGNEIKILTVMAKSKTPLTRKDLAEKTGIAKGWSRTLGASTKEDGGAAGEDSLEGRNLIAVEKLEGERQLKYTITAKGRSLLTKVTA